MRFRLKIIGLGNPYAQDDAIGLEIVRLLPDRLPADITFREIPFHGIELMDEFRDKIPIVFIDAVEDDRPVGSIACFHMNKNFSLPVETYDISEHSISVFEVVQLANEVGYALPPIYFISVSVNENGEFSEGFSAELSKRFPSILKKISQIIASLKAGLP